MQARIESDVCADLGAKCLKRRAGADWSLSLVLHPREGVCGGAKFFVSALLQPARSVCVSPSVFFHSLIKFNIFITSCVLNGHWGNDQLKSGHEDYNWVMTVRRYLHPNCNQPRDWTTLGQWKKRSERSKHWTLAVVRRSQKNSPRRRPPPGGAGRPKFNQLEMVTTFTYRPSLVKIDARNFELSW